MTIVKATQCPKCLDRIYSRARHDCRPCSCGNIFIDGGFDYTRIGGDTTIEVFRLKINATKLELYEDWNSARDKYGLIKGSKIKTIKKVKDEKWIRLFDRPAKIIPQLKKLFKGYNKKMRDKKLIESIKRGL